MILSRCLSEPFIHYRIGRQRSGSLYTTVGRSQTLQSWVVSGFYAGSPAEQSGLRIDDRIVSVNGKNICDIAYEERASFFRQYNNVTLVIRVKNN